MMILYLSRKFQYDRKFFPWMITFFLWQETVNLRNIFIENLYFLIAIVIRACFKKILKYIILFQYFWWLFNPLLEGSFNLPGKYLTIFYFIWRFFKKSRTHCDLGVSNSNNSTRALVNIKKKWYSFVMENLSKVDKYSTFAI